MKFLGEYQNELVRLDYVDAVLLRQAGYWESSEVLLSFCCLWGLCAGLRDGAWAVRIVVPTVGVMLLDLIDFQASKHCSDQGFRT